MNEEKLTKLIEQAIDGDIAAFEEVVKAKARQIIYISVKVMKNRQDGEDAAQEAMLKMYQHIGELKNPEAFHTWMYQIVTRTCIDIERKKIRDEYDYLETRDELSEMRREFLPQEYVEDVDKREVLMRIIDELPEYYRTSLLLFYYEDMSYQEIAQIMGVSEKSVSNTLFRAKQRIRQELERKHHPRFSLLPLQGAAAMPVLSQVFQVDAAASATPEMVSKILSGVSAGVGALAASGTALSGSASGAAGAASAAAGQASGTATSMAFGTSAKIVAGIVVTAAVAGGVIYGVFPGSEAPGLMENPPSQEEMIILTLADMIGEEAADQLSAFANGQDTEQEWNSFVDQLEVKQIGGAGDGTFQYILYHMEKQDKQLMILERFGNSGLEVAYRFTDSQEAQPDGPELLGLIERWQQ